MIRTPPRPTRPAPSFPPTTLSRATGVSCFAEYSVVSGRSCLKINTYTSHREAALFGCAVLTGAGAVLNRARIQAGDTAAVVGLGGVGLSALLAAAASGARRIVAVDLSDEKLQLAKELGATHLVNPRPITSDADLLEAADRKSTRLNSSHKCASRMPSSA